MRYILCLLICLLTIDSGFSQIKYRPVTPYNMKFGGLPVSALAKPDVDLRPLIQSFGLEIRNQGNRGTCSVFAMTFLIEFMNISYIGLSEKNLSEEYLNYVTNQASGGDSDGGFFAEIDKGFQTYGIVEESKMPYKDAAITTLPQQLLDQGKKSARFQTIFIKNWSNSSGAGDAQIQKVLAKLDLGLPVAFGGWWPKKDQAKFKTVNGVTMLDHQLKDRDFGDGKNNAGSLSDGHSVVIVGYKKLNSYPGGGFFIIRNSWGTDYGDKGYGFLSFEYAKNFANDLVTMDYSNIDSYNAVFVQSGIDEIQIYDWKFDDYKKKYDELWKQNYRLKQFSSRIKGTETLYSAVFKKGAEDEIQVYHWSAQDFYKKHIKLSKAGMYLEDFDINPNGTISGFWKKGIKEQILLGPLPKSKLNDLFTKPRKEGSGINIQTLPGYHLQGFFPSRIKVLKQGIQVLYMVILEKRNLQNYCFDKEFSDFATYGSKMYQQGYSPISLNAFKYQNKTYYSAVFDKTTDKETYLFGYRYCDYRSVYNKIWLDGWRLKILAPEK